MEGVDTVLPLACMAVVSRLGETRLWVRAKSSELCPTSEVVVGVVLGTDEGEDMLVSCWLLNST